MIELQTIEYLKQSVKITDYLLTKGISPVDFQNKQHVYCSPLTGETTGSFFVHPIQNVFNDFSSGEKGDNIRLVQLIEKIDFVSAVWRLKDFDPNNSNTLRYIPIKKASEEKEKQEIIEVKSLQHNALIKYVQSRAIPFEIALPYVKEVHYKFKGVKYFGVGFETDKGSFAIRSEKFKSWIGSSSITTLEVEGATAINLFEGFFDFLSALTYFRVKQMRNTTIVLNSNANISQCIERLKSASTVFTYLDTDGKGNNAGLAAMQRLRDAGCNIIDRSNLYAGYKDFNDRLRAL